MGDKAHYVQRCACIAVGKIGRKAWTSEVIAALVEASAENADFWDPWTIPVLAEALCSYHGMKELPSETISKLSSCISKLHLKQLIRLPSDILLKLYSESGDVSWLSLVVYVAMMQGVAVTAFDDTVKIYNSNGVKELQVSDGVLFENLIEAFNRQKTQLEGDSEAGVVN